MEHNMVINLCNLMQANKLIAGFRKGPPELRFVILTQNVMAVCDFDLRFTSIVAGWLGSMHDTRIFKDTLLKFEAIFPHTPLGICYACAKFIL